MTTCRSRTTAPSVSVLIPYRDAAATLRPAVEGVIADSAAVPGGFEVLLVDDRSTDGGPEWARAFAEHHPCVIALSAGAPGIAAALETGRRASRGRWIARMDADDLNLPGRVARAVARLEAHRALGAVASRVEAFADDGVALGEGLRRYVAWQNALVTPEEHRRDLFVESPLCHPATVLRRAALDAVGGWREGDFPEDYDLFLRLDAAGWALAKVPDVLFRWRHRAGRLTFADPRYSLESIRRLKARHLAGRLAAVDRPIAVWGAGPTGRRFARALEAHGRRAARFVDIDPRKVGRVARGAPIVAPEALRVGESLVLVAVGSPGARALVRAWLAERGSVEGHDHLVVA